jgi:hypothetical protein
MPYLPTGFVTQEEMDAEVGHAIRKLGPEVVRVRYQLTSDTAGDPAIYFRVVLADWAVQEETLADVTGKIARILIDESHAYDKGLVPHLKFRAASEQTNRHEPEWS